MDRQIPAVRAAVDESLNELSVQLQRLQVDGVIEPWLGDPVSEDVVRQYNARVMGAAGGSPGSAYGALVAYQAELVKIKESLELMERGYVGAEGDTKGDVEATYRTP
ncbi:hypothetical protein BJF90_07215 [Pseudonocardia sp. CNS-004]|nr:hypothetical protein BJF90_07215 [Pseudonocardia sp. CNS-004]